MIKSRTTTKEHRSLVEEAKALREQWKQYLQGVEAAEDNKKQPEEGKEKKVENGPPEISLGKSISTGELSQICNLY